MIFSPNKNSQAYHNALEVEGLAQRPVVNKTFVPQLAKPVRYYIHT
jgi:hypothetical protein